MSHDGEWLLIILGGKKTGEESFDLVRGYGRNACRANIMKVVTDTVNDRSSHSVNDIGKSCHGITLRFPQVQVEFD